MITEIQLSTLVFIAAVIWGILLLCQGIPISKALFEPFSTVTGVLVLLLVLFDKWAWHWKIFFPWLVSTPFIDGSWKGRIKSNWVNPETNHPIETIDAYLIIRQKFSKISAQLITKESISELLAGDMVKNQDSTWQFVGAYRNTPKILVRERSPIHHGSFIFQIKDKPSVGLEGEYWTDRNTHGELVFSLYNKKRFYDFNAASTVKFSKRSK